MNWIQTVNTLIFVFGMFVGVYEGIRLATIPAQRAVRLEQFAKMAVQQTEQQNAALSGPVKKQLALASAATLFKASKSAAPSAEEMDIAIESAVFLLPKANG
jgi:hypothetical protein